MGHLRVTLEIGPKVKKIVAVAPDWPGLERGDKTSKAVMAKLSSYRERYLPITEIAGVAAEFKATGEADVVEEYIGVGSTDFWGISFAFSSIDHEPMSDEELERQLALMRACWTYFDRVRGRVSAEMQKGPRGGGRDRDRIVRHVLGTEQDWARKVGVDTPIKERVIVEDDELGQYREAYCAAIRKYQADGKPARGWPLRYLIRHTAYHTMDHAWEMEDKDLSQDGAAAG